MIAGYLGLLAWSAPWVGRLDDQIQQRRLVAEYMEKAARQALANRL